MMRRMFLNPDLVIVGVLAIVAFGPSAWKQVRAEVAERQSRGARLPGEEQAVPRLRFIELQRFEHAPVAELPHFYIDERWDCPAPRRHAPRVWHYHCR